MATRTPSFLFHIPHHRDVITAEQLEQNMSARKPPTKVGVIDPFTKRRIGTMHPLVALAKFR